MKKNTAARTVADTLTAGAAWGRHFSGDVVIEKKALTTILDEAAEKHGDRDAVIFQNLRISYRQLRKKAEIFAAALRREGVKEGDRVAIMLPNIPQTVIAVWGVLKAGATAVMTNPLYMEKELTHHFKDSGAEVLVTLDLLWNKVAELEELRPRLSIVTRIADGLAFPLNLLQPVKARREGISPQVPYDGRTVIRWRKMFRCGERYAAEIADPEKAVALLQYTGGTTGFAKAAILTHENLYAQMRILNYVVSGTASSRLYSFLSIMPFFHVFGLVGNIMVPALYAASTIPVPRYTPHDLLETIKKYRPNFFVGAPSVYMSLMQQKNIGDYDLSCIELCISGSAPFPAEALRKFQQLTGARITEGFGLTEASPCLLANPLYGEQKTGSVGVPLPATEVRLVDLETGTRVLGDNEPGELIARGPQVMAGYWNNPEETAATLRDGWLHTGDIACRDKDGYYFIVDRKKDMAIVGGYNVYPREIDEVLYEHPKVADAVAVGVPHPSRGEILKAYIVVKPGETLTVPELVAHCRTRLANYKVPKVFEFREELPKTLIGKVLRRALREEESGRMKCGELPEDILPAMEGLSVEDPLLSMQALRDRAEMLMQEAQERAEELRKKAEELYHQAEHLIAETRLKAREHSALRREKAEKAAASKAAAVKSSNDEQAANSAAAGGPAAAMDASGETSATAQDIAAAGEIPAAAADAGDTQGAAGSAPVPGSATAPEDAPDAGTSSDAPADDAAEKASSKESASSRLREKAEEIRGQTEDLLHFARDKAEELSRRLENWRSRKK